mmetsp:Transcript_25344/g.58918  ORF Transcript_25344/g.58918 Transcript_25344/m.58918 type:complete len:580 (+) Transcript_25344:110-1849(+)
MAWKLPTSLLLFVMLFGTSQGALNIGTHAVSDLADDLRQFIFVDVAYLTERPRERCSSLDGPACFRFATGLPATTPGSDILTGLLPDAMLHDFGGSQRPDVMLDLPFHAFHEARAQVQEAAKDGKGLISAQDLVALQGHHVEQLSHGILHFSGLQPDRRVPLTFSRGLPPQVIATWDGKWIARHSSSQADEDGARDLLALPAASVASLSGSSAYPALPGIGSASGGDLSSASSGSDVSVTAELASSMGYVRFSQPVVIRSLFARWPIITDASKAPAVIRGRRGVDTVWTTYLDQGQHGQEAWLDITGGSLQPVDEVMVIGAGVELGAMWVVGSGPQRGRSVERLLDAGEESKALVTPRPVLLLSPTANSTDNKPEFTVRAEQVSAEAAPFLISLHDAAKRHMRLQVDPTKWGLPFSHGSSVNYPSMITTLTPAQLWTPEASATHMLMEHEMIGAWLAAGGSRVEMAARAGAIVTALETASGIPTDLRKTIKQDRGACVAALQAVAEHQLQQAVELAKVLEGDANSDAAGLARPTSAPYAHNEQKARRVRATLDVLAAAFLHAHQQTSELSFLLYGGAMR